MAVTINNQKSALRVYFETGLNEQGEPILSGKTYSNVKPTATPEEIHALAGTLATLQNFPLARVTRADQSDLEQI